MALTIGELSKRTGVSIKTLRFWSDEGLLPPSGRTRSRYRMYDEAAVVRVELVRTLRDAGIDLPTIVRILRRETTLEGALRLRLAAVEAHVASLNRVAASLRAALRSTTPTEDDLRRITAVTRLTNEERKATIESFYERVSEGIPIDEKWKAKMQAATPVLPDDPTPAQLDAWIEITELMNDATFIESLRANAKEVWKKGFDLAALERANAVVAAEAKEAMGRGVAPTSSEARPILERFAAGCAEASGRAGVDDALRRGMRERFARQDPRASRYWELVAILKGEPATTPRVAEWRWIAAAVLHHFA